MKLTVKNLDDKSVGSIDVDDAVFAAPVRKDILTRVVNWQLAKRRAGTHQVKERNAIKATGAKIYRQKGTGRARHGPRSAVQFRGGGVVHGPRVRSHAYPLPKKVRRLGLKTALSSKQAEGKLIVLDSLAVDGAKTKELGARLTGLGLTSALFIDGPEVNGEFARAAGNLIGIDVLPQQGANVYDILRCDTLVLTKDAVTQLEARLK